MKTTIITSDGTWVECTITPTNVHIKDSYRITDKKTMKEIIAKIRNYALVDFGNTYKRTEKQWLHEWRAHNLLYKLDYQMERTKSIDLDEGETSRNNFLYKVLSFLYIFIH
jgi:hypothetical protein